MDALRLTAEEKDIWAILCLWREAEAEDLGRRIGGDGAAVAELTRRHVFILGASGRAICAVDVCGGVQIPVL